MFRRCIFCHADLGRNEALEHFPVGRRIAFDAVHGRLWVVCPTCSQWNLSPLEERWEAIEDAERLFRSARKRVSTDEIGLARVADNTDLVRIGAPQRPELAAWRYAPRFRRRYTKHLLLAAGATAAFGGLVVGGAFMGMLGYGSYQAVKGLWDLSAGSYRKLKVVARFDDGAGAERVVSLAHLRRASLEPGADSRTWALRVASVRADTRWGKRLVQSIARADTTVVQHGEALRLAAALLPHANRAGGKSSDVDDAVRRLERGDSFHALAVKAARAAALEDNPRKRTLRHLDTDLRLALEMSLHEEDERRWLEGELYELEQRWREAEEIAAIADSLLVPQWVDDRIRGA